MRVLRRNSEYTAETGRTRKAFVDCYGCQQNEADSEQMRGMLLKMGYELAVDETDADVVVINTCAVREHAEMRVLGNVGALSHLKKARPDMVIAVGGCMTQQEHMAMKLKKSFPYVDIVFGTHATWRFPELLFRKLCEHKRVFDVESERGRIAEGLPVYRTDKVRGWVSIMYGCNNFCSYCIVPYVRGRERSRRADDVVRDVQQLVADDYREINLLGQNVNSYGHDLDEGVNFPELLRRIDRIPGDFVIRFMTSHPKDATRELIDTIADSEKIAHQLHLPVQSGSDRVLQAMNRRYTAASYLDLIRYARERMPDIVFTSDIIVGFPGETEEDFQQTLELVRQVRYNALFTFIYSKRKGTPAAEMEDPATDEEKQNRFERLLDVQNEISLQLHQAYVGKTIRILVDGKSTTKGYPLTGHTNGGRLVHLRGDESLIGSFAPVYIEKCSTWALNAVAEPKEQEK